jgi:type II restriction enzyme
MERIITPQAKERRAYWVKELTKLSGSFGDDSSRMVKELREEIERDGLNALLDHLRLCGAVPEQYEHDSSEEKLYSKYTDALISESLVAMGLQSSLINNRADAADVQARGHEYSLVVDAKAFRLSRTAKNQKDFKVQAMDDWRKGLDYAMLVCPIYQLPSRTSQIYQQAITRNVCILSYSHIAVLVGLALRSGKQSAERGLSVLLKTVSQLNPSKDAIAYWIGINRALTEELTKNNALDLWKTEKIASIEALEVAKEEALQYLRAERNRILGLSREEALKELILRTKIDARIEIVQNIKDTGLLEVV